MGLRDLIHKSGVGLSTAFRRERVRRAAAVLCFFVFLTFLLSVELFPHNVKLSVGQPSPRTIKAPHTVTFEDKAKTEEARRQEAAKVQRQYDFDPKVTVAVQDDVAEVINTLRAIQADETLERAEKVEQTKQNLPFVLPADVVGSLADGSPANLEILGRELGAMIERIMQREGGVKAENLADAKKQLYDDVRDAGFTRPHELLGRGLVNEFLRPNSFYNAILTEQLQRAAMDQVPPVQVTVKKEEKVIGEGEIVTAEHLAKLQALGLLQQPLPFKSVIGVALMILLLLGGILFYIYRQHREIYRNFNYLYLIGIILITVFLLGKIIIAVNVSQWPEFGTLMGYGVPLAAAGMLMAILIDSRLAIVVMAVMAILLGIMTGNDLRFALVGLVGGIAGVFSVSKLSQRTDLVRAGLFVAVANMVAIFAVGLITNVSWGLLLTSSLVLGVGNGLLSSILANGALPFLESTFRITSTVKLLELSNPSQPLLRQLLLEAPGTYHHSIIVGNLAEAAADAVGGDSVAVRVGAYYHDVGKIRRPYFFIENQMSAENPHDKIAPGLSTLILTSHVKDGVEMAREHKLPGKIVDIIEQHHGTSIINYFYHKALEQDEKNVVKADDFRYEGPKPQTREAAIVMLADAVEAGVRSLSNPTEGKIEGLVRKIVKDKLDDGQLEECDLNFQDLNRISSAFVRILTGIFHRRIEYPDAKDVERRKARNERGSKQLTG
ncbi:MAG: HDIG domain-containing protein [Desulforudis sp.]|nr:MAG: HDIG domain-containing protein [Desulforudis sp.]